MAWYIDSVNGRRCFDYLRLRRAMRTVAKIDQTFSAMWTMICKRNTADNVTRLVMADRLEDEGYPVEGKCLREYTTCRVKKQSKRRRKVRR